MPPLSRTDSQLVAEGLIAPVRGTCVLTQKGRQAAEDLERESRELSERPDRLRLLLAYLRRE